MAGRRNLDKEGAQIGHAAPGLPHTPSAFGQRFGFGNAAKPVLAQSFSQSIRKSDLVNRPFASFLLAVIFENDYRYFTQAAEAQKAGRRCGVVASRAATTTKTKGRTPFEGRRRFHY